MYLQFVTLQANHPPTFEMMHRHVDQFLSLPGQVITDPQAAEQLPPLTEAGEETVCQPGEGQDNTHIAAHTPVEREMCSDCDTV